VPDERVLLPEGRETEPEERVALPARLTAVARVEGVALREETTEREDADRVAELTFEDALRDRDERAAVRLRPAEREVPPLAA
jgi:hypothetical protein